MTPRFLFSTKRSASRLIFSAATFPGVRDASRLREDHGEE
jgi:hypothetical protein